MTSQDRLDFLEAELEAVMDGSLPPCVASRDIEAMILDEIQTALKERRKSKTDPVGKKRKTK